MYPLAIFVAVIIGALFSGAVIAYPLFLLVNVFAEVTFSDSAIFATQLCGLVFSLIYLSYVDTLNLSTLGYSAGAKQKSRYLINSFLYGVIIVVLLAMTLVISGVYEFHSEREITLASISLLLLSAIVTGIVVALFEETVFRGALLHGLLTKTNAALAIIMTSIVYAGVHFIDYPIPGPGETINMFTASAMFLSAFSSLINIENFDALLSLMILGLLLGLIRVRTKGILQCIGLHAGLVVGIKLFRFFLQYRSGNPYDFLASSYDHRLGIAAVIWLSLATMFYYFFIFRRPRNY